MNRTISENSMFINGVVSHERNIRAWVDIPNVTAVLQTGVFVDSTEIWYTEVKFLLNTFPRRCDGWSFFQSDEKQLLR